MKEMKIKGYERRKCAVEGCKSFGRNKGFYKGKTRYDKYCQFHHKSLNGFAKEVFVAKLSISNSQCERCGWNKAYCDRHRINPKLGYERDNVIILCPNCHRLEETRKMFKKINYV